MSEAARRVQQAARDARSNDDLVQDDSWGFEGDALTPLDEPTLDEIASLPWEPVRRDAN